MESWSPRVTSIPAAAVASWVSASFRAWSRVPFTITETERRVVAPGFCTIRSVFFETW